MRKIVCGLLSLSLLFSMGVHCAELKIVHHTDDESIVIKEEKDDSLSFSYCQGDKCESIGRGSYSLKHLKAAYKNVVKDAKTRFWKDAAIVAATSVLGFFVFRKIADYRNVDSVPYEIGGTLLGAGSGSLFAIFDGNDPKALKEYANPIIKFIHRGNDGNMVVLTEEPIEDVAAGLSELLLEYKEW